MQISLLETELKNVFTGYLVDLDILLV